MALGNCSSRCWRPASHRPPPKELSDNDPAGATEHIRRRFVAWLCDVLRAIKQHKKEPATVEARARSGKAWGKHGLTAEQVQTRDDLRRARSDLEIAKQLEKRLWKGQLSWWDMSYKQQGMLMALRNGTLAWRFEAAKEAHGGPVRAGPFQLRDKKSWLLHWNSDW